MYNKYLILSDIHGNLSAFNAVLSDCNKEHFSGIILLGDCIDYCMRSNDIIKSIKELCLNSWKGKIVANIWGNHEKLVIDKDYEHLSSDRGRLMANYTARHLSDVSIDYIQNHMNKDGAFEFTLDGLNCLAIHGSLENEYWLSIAPNDLHGIYDKYDIVFSGHSHYSHCFQHFYPTDNPRLRNKKAVIFINPGSVGQPRNQNPFAQYAVLTLPSKQVELRAVEYDIKYEQSLFPTSENIDKFYKERLTYGI